MKPTLPFGLFKIKGRVEYRVYDGQGHLVSKKKVTNVVVDTMLNNVINAFIATSSNPCSGFQYIALGRGDTPETINDTELDDEFEVASFGGTNYATRIDGSVSVDYTSNTYTVTGEITNESGSTLEVNESGLFNSDTVADTGASAEMGSRATVDSAIQLQNNEKLEVTWQWTVSAS